MLPRYRLGGLAVIVITCMFALSRAAAGQSPPSPAKYGIRDLGALSGDVSAATALNKYGDVVGTSVASGSKVHAVLYRSDTGAIQELSDGENDAATGINDAGQVTFNYNRISYPVYGYLWDGGTSTFLTGGYYDEQWNVVTAGINNAGQIAGTLAPQRWSSLTLWEPGGATVTGVVGGAIAISDTGVIVGSRWYGGDVFGSVWWTKADGFHPLGPSYEIPAAINRAGQVTGGADYSQAVRNGYAQHAFVTQARADARPGDLVDIGTLGGDVSYGYGINTLGQVVGSSNLVPNGPKHAFFWQSGQMTDLNALVPANSGWTLTEAKGINDYGQICGTGINPDGQQHAYLLTPIGTHISGSTIPLVADYPGGGPVDGIVCDNLPKMDTSLLDRLKITVTGYDQADFSDSKVIGASPGRLDATQQGVLYYYPPDEFNVNQTPSGPGDLTKDATRQVTLFIRFKAGGQYYTVDPKQVTLARPPVVLVHGINSGPTNWQPFDARVRTTAPTGLGLDIPLFTLNHRDALNASEPDKLYNGNGAVEVGAWLLSQRIQKIIGQVRAGSASGIDDGFFPPYAYIYRDGSANRPTETYVKGLAIRRVDTVAWSYGGVITRWYIASRGNASSYGWYHRQETLPSPINSPVTDYMADEKPIRKVITLGSMWRGVPLANYLNEDLSVPVNGISLGQAPLTGGIGTIGGLIELLPNVSPLLTRVPSMEVMAVNSRWQSTLLFQTDNPATGQQAHPFDDDIAYGSVAGDNNMYLPLFSPLDVFGKLVDPYSMIHKSQLPSWFPYLGMERLYSSSRNYTDGLVPLWSAAIPGSYKIAAIDHADYAGNPETQDYVVQWLNHSGLPIGRTTSPSHLGLNDLWNSPDLATVQSATEIGPQKTWRFRVGEMAPHVQNDVYRQIGGIGRINPSALREINSATVTNVTATSAEFSWITATESSSNDVIINRKGPWPTSHNTFSDGIKIHRKFITGLNPGTTYYWGVSSQFDNDVDGAFDIQSPSGDAIFFRTKDTDDPALDPKPQLSFRITNGAAPNRFTLAITNKGGNAYQFNISGLTFNKGGYTFSYMNPAFIDIPGGGTASVTVGYEGANPSGLSCQVRGSYANVNGQILVVSTPYMRVN